MREGWRHRSGESSFAGGGDPETPNTRGRSIFPLDLGATEGNLCLHLRVNGG